MLVSTNERGKSMTDDQSQARKLTLCSSLSSCQGLLLTQLVVAWLLPGKWQYSHCSSGNVSTGGYGNWQGCDNLGTAVSLVWPGLSCTAENFAGKFLQDLSKIRQ